MRQSHVAASIVFACSARADVNKAVLGCTPPQLDCPKCDKTTPVHPDLKTDRKPQVPHRPCRSRPRLVFVATKSEPETAGCGGSVTTASVRRAGSTGRPSIKRASPRSTWQPSALTTAKSAPSHPPSIHCHHSLGYSDENAFRTFPIFASFEQVMQILLNNSADVNLPTSKPAAILLRDPTAAVLGTHRYQL